MDWELLKEKAKKAGFIDNGFEVEKTTDKNSFAFTDDGRFFISYFEIGAFSGFWRKQSAKEKTKDFFISIKNKFLNRKYNKRIKKWLKK